MLQHLETYVLPEEEESACVYCCDDAAVLILTVDVGADAAVEEVGGEPGVSVVGEGLGGAAEVREFVGVDAGEADVDLRGEGC